MGMVACTVVLQGCGGASCDAAKVAQCATDYSEATKEKPGDKDVLCPAMDVYAACLGKALNGCSDEIKGPAEEGLASMQTAAADLCKPNGGAAATVTTV